MKDTVPSGNRLLAGVIIVGIQWILWLFIPLLFPEMFIAGVAAATIGTVIFLIWWLFFSRYPLSDRWGAFALVLVAVLSFSFLLDESIDTGNMGLMYYMYSLPNICLAIILALLIGRKLSPLYRRVILALLIILAPGIFSLLRSDGLDGEGRAMLNWRWAGTAEDRLMAAGEDAWKIETDKMQEDEELYWPGFRGRNRDSRLGSIVIDTDWESTPPELLWKQPVGPGCSSFAIMGDRFYTQEQRGDFELVSCYKLNTGGLIWKHEDKARFYDSHAGAGPRATPLLNQGRVYTLGGTGILNALDAQTGDIIWTRNAAKEQDMEALTWGFCASPLIVDDALIIALAGKLSAYHKDNGQLLWEAKDGGNSYSSPQVFSIEGEEQVLFMSKTGCSSHNPATGALNWTYEWEISDRILQPALTAGGQLLLTKEMTGLRCVDIRKSNGSWQFEEKWTCESMKLNFNDFVVHEGFAYGFDGPSLACVDLETGVRTWKGKRYRGWILLLPEQDLQIILSEKGELVLAEAKPETFNELGSIKAIEGRTWNHPAMGRDIILVRNSEEMAAYKLATIR